MFGPKTNDTLITSIVGALGAGIIFVVITSYQLKNDMQILKTNLIKEVSTLKEVINKSEKK